MNDAPAPGPNWFGRNWKWFVPVGCLSLLMLFVAVVCLFAVGVFGMMRHAEPYQHALAAAQANPQVIAVTGQPIESGFMVQGNITTHNDSGSADMYVPITGPKGKATVHVVAEKTRDQWTYEVLEADVGAGPPIDLRPSAPAP
jgi:Cytochrome oxidase complex assembly protein 1